MERVGPRAVLVLALVVLGVLAGALVAAFVALVRASWRDRTGGDG